ncbi:MAG: response regulator [Deltaproteobacteria bacterium]|nr:response regulator [Deltaproteobacteria bacterium]
MNILVVDDEAVMVESIKIGLESNGYRVFEALSAQQALDRLSHADHGIDLIATDYLMPSMNGIDLLEAVRKSHPTLPILIMTAYAETRLVIEALKSQCDSFIEKPFRLDQLVAEIERIKLRLLQNTRSGDLHELLPRIVHQINNPLFVINGFAELILSNGDNGDAVRSYAEDILNAVNQIGRINKEIMNAGRMEASKFEPVDLHALLDACLEMFQGIFTLKGIQVERKIPGQEPWIMGDRFSLEQVFNNLMLNAADAMNGRSEKTLTITVTPGQGPDFVDVTVEDTGCGIREDFLDKIFEPYFTDKSQGNGLGLVVIKNAVEKHGGKVLVESRLGVGTRFTVRLPAMRTDRRKQRDRARIPPDR